MGDGRSGVNKQTNQIPMEPSCLSAEQTTVRFKSEAQGDHGRPAFKFVCIVTMLLARVQPVSFVVPSLAGTALTVGRRLADAPWTTATLPSACSWTKSWPATAPRVHRSLGMSSSAGATKKPSQGFLQKGMGFPGATKLVQGDCRCCTGSGVAFDILGVYAGLLFLA